MILERLSDYEEHTLQLDEMEVRQQADKVERREAHDEKQREKRSGGHDPSHNHGHGHGHGERNRSRGNSISSMEGDEKKAADDHSHDHGHEHGHDHGHDHGHVHGHGRRLSAEEIQRQVAEEVAYREMKQTKALVETQRVNMQRSVPGETAKDR
jgi:hypothetical protein